MMAFIPAPASLRSVGLEGWSGQSERANAGVFRLGRKKWSHTRIFFSPLRISRISPISCISTSSSSSSPKSAAPMAKAVQGQSWIADMAAYEERYKRSVSDPDAYWSEEASCIAWENGVVPRASPTHNFKPPGVNTQWFKEGRTNACYNALDRWIEKGYADRPALLCEGNSDVSRTVTYGDLFATVQKFANALKNAGVKKGDCVIIYLPMIPELPAAMLALARIGAVHAVVFGGFSAESLAQRIVASDASVVITCEHVVRGTKTIPLKGIADQAAEIAKSKGVSVKTMFVVKAFEASSEPNPVPAAIDAGRDIYWDEAVEKANDKCEIEWVNAEEPLFVLYTSGSTGSPKGVTHSTGGYLVYAATTFKYGFDFHPDSGDVWFCTADCGWITGHSYVTYGPMLNGATQVLIGGVPTYPDPGRLWQIVEKYKVTHIYTAPTAVRALMGVKPPAGGSVAADWVTKHDTSSLRILGSVGEPIGAEAWRWYRDVVGGNRPNVKVVDTWWQTETGGIMIVSLPLKNIPEKPGCAMLPMPGVVPILLSASGEIVSGPGEGLLAIKDPWPGMLRTTQGDHSRMESVYFSQHPGYYLTGDGARRDKDGHFWLTGRADDVINVSGHRIGSAEVETAIGKEPSVAEAAVVGFPHAIKGEALYAYVSVRSGVEVNDELKAKIRAVVLKEIGAFSLPDTIHWATGGLPKTRSGKIMRRILRCIAKDGVDTKMDSLGDTSTLTDPSVVEKLLQSVPSSC